MVMVPIAQSFILAEHILYHPKMDIHLLRIIQIPLIGPLVMGVIIITPGLICIHRNLIGMRMHCLLIHSILIHSMTTFYIILAGNMFIEIRMYI